MTVHSREKPATNKNLLERKTIGVQETAPDHVPSVVIIWHQKTWTQSKEGLYLWTRACSLGLCASSPALCAEQKLVSQKNEPYPAIPESHTEEPSCLPSNHSSYLHINGQHQGSYCPILVYFNCWLKPQGSQNEVYEMQAMDNLQATCNHFDLFVFPSCVQCTKHENQYLQQRPRAFCLMCCNSKNSLCLLCCL